MDVENESLIDRAITSALGAELQRAREDLGLSQAQLVERIPSGLHKKTLASYEQGARQCTVVRLCEIARALKVSAVDLLTKALMHADIHLHDVCMYVDLRALADDSRPELRSLRRWARARLATYPTLELAHLTGDTIQEMALLLDFQLTALYEQLSRFTLEERCHQN